MKRKTLLLILAVSGAVYLPRMATGQVSPEGTPAPVDQRPMKYEAYAGWGYTSINQVNQSNNGLQGVTLGVRRDWGKYFGLALQGGHYQWTITRANPVNTSVNMYFAGPEVHAPIFDRASVFVHGLLGVAHTGGVSIRPDESFAGGFGIGVAYQLGPHLGLRVFGDDIGSAFTLQPFQPGFSPHTSWNAHASFGVTYRF